MHQITVSDEVMSKLHALCLIEGKNEDFVMRRLLCCPESDLPDSKEDFIDITYGIRFPKGSMIFRTYKGKSYTARVSSGSWILDGENKIIRTLDSLNQLSQAVVDGNENAWKFWYYLTPDNKTRCISNLRDPNLVKRYQRRKLAKKDTIKPIVKSAIKYSKSNSSVSNDFVQTEIAPLQITAKQSSSIIKMSAGKKPWERG